MKGKKRIEREREILRALGMELCDQREREREREREMDGEGPGQVVDGKNEIRLKLKPCFERS